LDEATAGLLSDAQTMKLATDMMALVWQRTLTR
jgi:hypothetical protein